VKGDASLLEFPRIRKVLVATVVAFVWLVGSAGNSNANGNPRDVALVDLVPLINRFLPVLLETVQPNGTVAMESSGSSHQLAVEFLRANGIDIWEEYPAFVLANITPQDRSWLVDQGLDIWALEDRTMVGRGQYRFDTRYGEPPIPDDLREQLSPDQRFALRIIQFTGPVKESWVDLLRSLSVIPLDFLGNFAILAKVPTSVLSTVVSYPFVQWIGPYHPAYKLSPELGVTKRAAQELGPVIVSALAEDIVALKSQLLAAGFQVIVGHVSGDRVIFEGSADVTSVKAVSRIPHVLWVEPLRNAIASNNQAVWIIQSGVSGSTPVHNQGLRGQGQIITMMDTGLTTSHEMFYDPEGDPVGASHRKVLAYYVPGGGSGGDGVDGCGHGTHVAGSAMGDAPVYGTYNLFDGMAFGARIIVQDIGFSACALNGPEDAAPAYGAARSAGSFVHTNSWGTPRCYFPWCGPAVYSSYDNTLDNFVWQNRDFLVLHAAGNDGAYGAQTLSEQASAKNLITVGATLNGASSNAVADFSSRGGTLDARLKPTVVAPGDGVISARAPAHAGCIQIDANYQQCSGTSMATPIVAGAAAMVRQYFTEGWYPTGQPIAANSFVPSAALLRAMLINGAVELSGAGAYRTDAKYPNNDQGWGRINLDNVLYFSGDSRRSWVVDETWGLQTGQYMEYQFSVGAYVPFEVTLVWTDPAGAAGCNPCLVNNLDLLVTDPFGLQYKGNVFSGMNPGASALGGQYDSRNVEEGALLLNPSSGTYRVRVTATNVPTGPQPYAVVVTAGLADPFEVPVSTLVDHSTAPASVVDSSGRTHLVWQDLNDGDYEIFYTRLKAAPATAASAVEIRSQLTRDSKPSSNPAIAINPTNGEIWVVYQGIADGDVWSTHDLWYRKSADSGVSWQGPYRVTGPQTPTRDYHQPSIVIDANGRKHIVARYWFLYSPPEPDQDWERAWYLWTDMATPTYQGDWQSKAIAPTYVRSHTTCVANAMVYDPNLALGPGSSQIQVVYSVDPVPECGTGTGTTYVRHVRSSDRGASWSAEITLGTTRDYARPNTVVTGGTTDVFAAWHDWSSDFDIFFSRSTNGGSSWSAPSRVLSTAYREIYPSLAHANGVLALSWADNGLGNFEIFVRKSTDRGISWSASVRITIEAAVSSYPVVRLSATASIYLVGWADTRNNGNSWYDIIFTHRAT